MNKKSTIKYIDGYLLPIPKRHLALYKRVASKVGVIYRDHGALEYIECVAADMKWTMGVSFPKMVKTKPSEMVVFSWIGFKSAAHRKSVNAKVLKDPRMLKMMNSKDMPFDCKRMACGGFKVLVNAK